MSERQTWYVMADGSFGDPREVRPGPDGLLRHKDGRAVAYAPHGPRSRSVDPDAMRAKSSRAMTASDDKPAGAGREMQPAMGENPPPPPDGDTAGVTGSPPKGRYRTRGR